MYIISYRLLLSLELTRIVSRSFRKCYVPVRVHITDNEILMHLQNNGTFRT